MEINLDAIEWAIPHGLGHSLRPEDIPRVKIVSTRNTSKTPAIKIYMNFKMLETLGLPEKLRVGISKSPKGLVVAVMKIGETGGYGITNRKGIEYPREDGRYNRPSPFVMILRGLDWLEANEIVLPFETWLPVKVDVVNKRFFLQGA